MLDGLRKPAEAMAPTLFAKKLDVVVKKTKFPEVPKNSRVSTNFPLHITSRASSVTTPGGA
jgi:hypothetical protein